MSKKKKKRRKEKNQENAICKFNQDNSYFFLFSFPCLILNMKCSKQQKFKYKSWWTCNK